MAEPTTPIFPRALAAPNAEKGAAMRLGPLTLDGGRTLPEFTLAYMTYGALNSDRSNAILVCHALTGDQFAASVNPVTGKDGWWDEMVGPGKPIDTERFFVICINVLGGCLGSTGPASNDPTTGGPYALGFPLITIRDMVRAQALLLDGLGIEKLFCVTGGSMGGMQVLEWAVTFPDRVARALPIATAARHTAQNIALHEVGRQAIMSDPAWDDGCYGNAQPGKGLAVARMVGHISYLSEKALERKFGRNLQNRASLSFGFERDFQVESYLHHQGTSFVERFDANSYLYITRAMDYFDLAAEHGGDLKKALAKSTARFQCVSFTSDWLFPTSENKRIAEALPPQNARFTEIATDKGHDAFLLDEPELHALVRDFLGRN